MIFKTVFDKLNLLKEALKHYASKYKAVWWVEFKAEKSSLAQLRMLKPKLLLQSYHQDFQLYLRKSLLFLLIFLLFHLLKSKLRVCHLPTLISCIPLCNCLFSQSLEASRNDSLQTQNANFKLKSLIFSCCR